MTAIVFGSPEAAAARQLDRQIESLAPCLCGGLPELSRTPDGHVILECNRRTSITRCARDNSSTLLCRTVEGAIAEWRRYHPDAAKKK